MEATAIRKKIRPDLKLYFIENPSLRDGFFHILSYERLFGGTGNNARKIYRAFGGDGKGNGKKVRYGEVYRT